MVMRKDYSILFEPLKLKSITLRNRIVVPPMRTNRNIMGSDGIEWYRNLARGGAGLVIVEAIPVEWFESKFSVNDLRRLFDAVHKEGARIVIQLFPATSGDKNAPHTLTLSEIKKMREQFALAASKCEKAGLDGVEPHGAHGFLLNQFFSPIKNLRRDNYGGELVNRMRLGREIVLAIRNKAGSDFLILYRHTPCEDRGYTINDSISFAKFLVQDGVNIMDISPASIQEPADLAAPIKRAIGIPVIAVGEMDDPQRAVSALSKRRADLIAIGRGLIADPEWPNKVRDGRFDEIVKCVKCNKKCYGNLEKGIPIECTQWDQN